MSRENIMLSLKRFNIRKKLKNGATSNIKIQQGLDSNELNNVEIYLGDGSFSKVIGIVNLHPFHWVLTG